MNAPPSLTAAEGPGAIELAAAREHFKTSAQTFDFRAYKRDDVKAALEELFGGKCAYCEGSYAGVSPVDIEHYRPKGAVAGVNDHPGYWWIAMSWDNLLPSCIDCNRRRRQITVTPEMTLEDVERLRAKAKPSNAGKKDAFPIRGRRCVPEEMQFSVEEALLIDPTRADPGQHLVFSLDFPFSLIIPVAIDGTPDTSGKVSIAVYGLNRLGLVQARTELLLRLRIAESRIDRFLGYIAVARSSRERKLWLQEATAAFDEIEALCNPKKPFSALALTFVNRLRRRFAEEIA